MQFQLTLLSKTLIAFLTAESFLYTSQVVRQRTLREEFLVTMIAGKLLPRTLESQMLL